MSAERFASAKGRGSTLPPASDMAAMIRDGATTEELAEEYGCHVSTVRKVLSASGFLQQKAETAPELPVLVWEDQPWRDSALCAQVDPSLWFPEQGETSTTAKAICAACPARIKCLDYSIRAGERWGLWGGLSERERRPLRRAYLAAHDLPAGLPSTPRTETGGDSTTDAA